MVRRKPSDFIIVEVKHCGFCLGNITAEQQPKFSHAFMIMRDIVEYRDVGSV